jgi:hypothetical protein
VLSAYVIRAISKHPRDSHLHAYLKIVHETLVYVMKISKEARKEYNALQRNNWYLLLINAYISKPKMALSRFHTWLRVSIVLHYLDSKYSSFPDALFH